MWECAGVTPLTFETPGVVSVLALLGELVLSPAVCCLSPDVGFPWDPARTVWDHGAGAIPDFPGISSSPMRIILGTLVLPSLHISPQDGVFKN